MKRRRKKLLTGAAILLLLAGGFSGSYLKRVSDYKKKVREIVLKEVDLSNIADGSYIGEYDAGLIAAKAEVTVKDKKILRIELLEHKNEHGASAEKIIEDVVKKQTLQVDAISGATNSSKVILKAVENALENGK